MTDNIPSDEEFDKKIQLAIKNYAGLMDRLEAGVGMFVVGRYTGWRVVYLVHGKSTIRKYEDAFGMKIRDVLPEYGIYAKKSIALEALQKVTNFWKAVKGEIPGVKTPELKKL
jgi:hypothetical protein